jgi:meso-butanediol dehydrogenase/(S,S)-butanediol dehydrogenase/diacetyl reductase
VTRVVLVTGAASGIGRATAERFLADGAAVAGLDLNGGMPEGASSHHCDVTSTASVREAVAEVADLHGRIDVVANVAGIPQFGHVEDISDDEWDRVLDVDLTGPFRVIRAALPHLRASRGCVVNVASVAGIQGQAYTAAYCAAKGGLVLLTRALAIELAADGVRVSCVCPAAVDTPLLGDVAGRIPADVDPRLMDRLQMLLPGGMLTADQVAGAIAYLASDDAALASGTILNLDGASSA